MSTPQPIPSLTPRAYTFRLAPAKSGDDSWRTALWLTHAAVNRGVRVFGDWMLTMRGGLAHTIATDPVRTKKGERSPTPAERKGRRILLALSWLSTESRAGAPAEYIVPQTDGRWDTVDTLRSILNKRGVVEDEIDQWIADCQPTIESAIRDDAVWVNRSAAFDALAATLPSPSVREDAQSVIQHVFGEGVVYMADPHAEKQPKAQAAAKKRPVAAAQPSVDDASEPTVEMADDEEDRESTRASAKASSEGAGRQTRHLFCHLFGAAPRFGSATVYSLTHREHWARHLRDRLASCIPIQAEKRHVKKGDVVRAPTALQYEMFAKAAARMAMLLTKHKSQEAERAARAVDADTLDRLASDPACAQAIELLDEYCVQREEETESLHRYMIRPRQISGWNRIVEAWASLPDGGDADKRIEAVEHLQADSIEAEWKFGDHTLFRALANDQGLPVWQRGGKADPTLLTRYVSGRQADADRTRLKVGAYRHPDPCFAPVFLQYGASKPAIRFARLDPDTDDPKRIELLVWDNVQAKMTAMRAMSRRFDREIGSITDSSNTQLLSVTRRSRLGRAVTHSTELDPSRVASVFDRRAVTPRKARDDAPPRKTKAKGSTQATKRPEWNATLRADRATLARIGLALERDRNIVARMISKLEWHLTTSLDLRPQGPWLDYAAQHGIVLETDRTGAILPAPRRSTDVWRGLAYPFWHAHNKAGRKGYAKHQLSRMPPGLRVLAGTIGIRNSGACAIWETCSADQVAEACRAVDVPSPAPDAAYLHLPKGRSRVIYRRIACDTYDHITPDTGELAATPTPAPWARLDRQFVIRLHGEDTETRLASTDELWAAHRIEEECGRTVPLIDRLVARGFGETPAQRARLDALQKLGWRPRHEAAPEADDLSYPADIHADRVMGDALASARAALRRHSDYARIAHTLSDPVSVAGRTGRTDAEVVLSAVTLWHRILLSPKWRDPWAQTQWNEQILPLAQPGEDFAGPLRFLSKKEIAAELEPIARSLLTHPEARAKITEVFAARWRHNNGTSEKGSKGTGWYARIRSLSDWIGDKAGRRVGGYSLSRITLLRELYRVHKSFRQRLTPDGTSTGVPPGPDYCATLLGKAQRLRDGRSKLLASRFVDAALGLDGELRQRFSPCHAIAIADLGGLRPTQTKGRRVNRAITELRPAEFQRHLAELCQLHGLHLRLVAAAHYMAQDSHTGMPGMRFAQMPGKLFGGSAFWRRRAEAARTKKADPVCVYIAALSARCQASQSVAPILLPADYGPRFRTSAGTEIDADINGAATIGIRALTDPDWPGAWWWVPVDARTHVPLESRVGGSAAIGADSLQVEGNGSAARDTINVWRDPSPSPVGTTPWRTSAEYWRSVEAAVLGAVP